MGDDWGIVNVRRGDAREGWGSDGILRTKRVSVELFLNAEGAGVTQRQGRGKVLDCLYTVCSQGGSRLGKSWSLKSLLKPQVSRAHGKPISVYADL